jgi:PST family polysaccharide transporter
MIRNISIITFPALAGLLILAPEFIEVVFSEKWKGVIIPMQIMCVAGMLKSVGTTVGSIFYAKGRPGLELKLDIVSILTLVPLLLLGVKHGIIGVSIGVVVHSLMMRFMYFGFLAKLIDIRLVDIIKAVSSAISLSLLMSIALVSYRFGFNLVLHNTIILLTSAICLGALLYVIILRIFYRDIYEEAIGPMVRKLAAINPIISNGRRLTWKLMTKK